MKDKPEERPVPKPPIKRRGTVLDQLRSRRAEKDALAQARPGATLPSVPKPAAPPRTIPAAAQSPANAVTPPAQAQQPPPPPPGDEPEGNMLEMLFARAMRHRSGTKPANDPGMAMLQALALQVQTGKPLKDIENITVPHLGEMTSKIHLWSNAMAYHNMFERGALLSLARWTLEKSLWEDLINQRLAPQEKLALLQLAIRESDKVQTGLVDFQHSLEGGGRGTTADIESATEKADRSHVKEADPAAKHLEGTTSTGRELARRILDTAGKSAEKIVADALQEQKPA